MYLIAREWDIQPSEFWDMTMAEWWCEYDHRSTSSGDGKFAGKLTRSDVDELKAFAEDGNTTD